MDLLAHTPLCASSFLFFMQQTTAIGFRHDTRVQLMTIAKAFLLLASLASIWLAVMFAIQWYDPGFHLLATSASAISVSTGNGQGFVEMIIA